MASRRLAHFGAFDHDSFGDLLMPHVAEHMLADAFEIVHVAPTDDATAWTDARPIITAAEAIARDDWDGVLVGGGDIIQATLWSTALWTVDDATRTDVAGLVACWIGAGLLGARLEIPVVWNAPGVPQPVPETFESQARRALAAVDYLAVRDDVSLANLAGVVASAETAVIPDTAISVADVWPVADERSGLLAVCVGAADSRDRGADLAAGIATARAAIDAGGVVELPLMAWADGTSDATERRTLRDVAEVIGASSGYLGNSLHGFIAAVSYGRPAVLVVPRGAASTHKYDGFVAAIGGDPADHIASDWSQGAALIGAAPVIDWRRAAGPVMAAHWARVRATLLQPHRSAKLPIWRSAVSVATADAADAARLGLAPGVVSSLLADASTELGSAASTARSLGEHAARLEEEIARLVEERSAELTRSRAEAAAGAAEVHAAHVDAALLAERLIATQVAQARAELRTDEQARRVDELQLRQNTVDLQLAALAIARDATSRELAAATAERDAMAASSSWRLTEPLREFARRHPSVLARIRGAGRGTAEDRSRFGPASSSRPSGGSGADTTNDRTARDRPTTPLVGDRAVTGRSITSARDDVVRTLSTERLGPPQADPGADARRILCVSHVLPGAARAGNSYRIERMLRWLSERGEAITLVVSPLPGHWPSHDELAAAAARFPRLIVVDRAGRVFHNLADGGAIDDIDGAAVDAEAAAVSHAAGGSDETGSDVVEIARRFCPDWLVRVVALLDRATPFDVVLAEYVFMSRAFAAVDHAVLKIVDTHDVFSSKQTNVVDLGFADELVLSGAQEARLLAGADVVIGIQPGETSMLRRLAGAARVINVGLDFEVVEPSAPAAGPTALVVASDNPLNGRGLADLIRFAWPIVIADVPKARLRVVGDVGRTLVDPPDTVDVVGRVVDLAPEYQGAAVAVNPAVAGTGLKVKTVEALAHLCPVVGFPAAVDGVAPLGEPFVTVVSTWPELGRRLVTRLTSPLGPEERIELARSVTTTVSADVVYRELAEVLDAL